MQRNAHQEGKCKSSESKPSQVTSTQDSCFDEFIVLVLGCHALAARLGSRREQLLVQTEHLVLVLDQLVSLADLVAFNGLCEGQSQDLAAVVGSPFGIKRISYPSIGDRCSGRMLDLLVGRRIATSVRDVVLQSSAAFAARRSGPMATSALLLLFAYTFAVSWRYRIRAKDCGETRGNILVDDVNARLVHVDGAGRADVVVFSAAAWSIDGTMRPLDARRLVAVAFFGSAAQVTGKELLRCHDAVESLELGFGS